METENKREKILQAAIKVLNKENYENMKTARIASEAGVSEGTIYRYFENKRALFIDVIRYITKRLAELMLLGASQENPVRENIEILAANFFKRSEEADTLYKIYYKAYSELDDTEIKEALSEIYINSIEIVKDAIRWNRREDSEKSIDAKLERLVMLLWGIGDILWKRDIVMNRRGLQAEEMRLFIDMILQLMN